MAGRQPGGGGSGRALPSVGSGWRGGGRQRRKRGGRRQATGCGGALPSPGSGRRGGGRQWAMAAAAAQEGRRRAAMMFFFDLEKGVCAVTALGEFGSDSNRLSLFFFWLG
uniref:Uncharacterized protein n=1 Tax=Oryza meridionalis TaxID=40149 RepID=A0A0E0DRI5_9ORYZ